MLKKNFAKKALSIFTVTALLSSAFTFASAADSYGKQKSLDLNSIEQSSETANVIVRDNKGKKIIYKSGKLTKASKKSVEDITKDYVKENEGILETVKNKLNNYKVKAKHDNVYGKTVMELEQTYKNIPVYGTTKYVHVDKEGAVDLVSGYFLPEIENAKGLENAIYLSDKEALNVIMKDLNLIDPSLLTVKSDLNVYPIEENNDAVYAYKVDITYSEPVFGNWTYFIDASNGDIIKKQNHVRAEHAYAQGKDSNGVMRVLSADKSEIFGSFYLMSLRNPKASNLYTCTCNGTNKVGDIFSVINSDTFTDPAAVEAHLYGTQTYNYFYNKFNRKGYDNEGSSLKIGVHYSEPNNAYSWGNGTIVFGDGDGVNNRSFTAGIDVVAHETTHEIIRDEIGLGGVLQADTINESLSDTFSALVSSNCGKTNAQSWTIGEDVTINGRGLRSMSDPSLFSQPDHMSEYNSNASCYYNIGILNKAAFLISDGGTFSAYTIKGIGKAKLAKIYYRAITNKTLTSNATFDQFYYSIRDAAADIYGVNSIEYHAVRAAFAAVGIDDKLIIYEHEGYAGKQTYPLTEGDYRLSDLQARGFINDWASSVYLPSGYTIQLFDEDGLNSNAILSYNQWVLSGEGELTKRFTTIHNNPNDRISSVRIRKGVTFYENAGYSGRCTGGILPGKYTLANLARYGFSGSWASSVVIPEGWYVILYGGDNFTGDPIRLGQMDANSENLANIYMSDNVSSIEVGIE